MSQLVSADVTPSRGHERIEARDLRVVLEIVRGGSCFMDGVDGDIVDVDVRFENEQCHCDVTVRTEDEDGEENVETKYGSNDVCSHCPGVIFSNHGCIPRFLGVGDGWFVVETYAADTETVSSLVSDVREVSERVSVKSLVSTDRDGHDDVCSVDISTLTPKQREAVEHATEAGYYDPDTRVPLEDLAADLGISSSALSQRLRRAESNVMRQVACKSECLD
ncbi:helix-turn-helix domain-containing protein [Natrarchaeobaculum sulfurireducens]|uniref:Transcriptional activator for anaerobic respiration with dimethyl sulfoxide and trimethylamine-N-oxide n=1 Tax=Natrarchaeobaculum sulfurireducens TaxID=2044521 RepID=A0A346PT09_9EURY|nr:helix-turn-helix domain-containing protein [Natrarchaeobaculum sulfurireducens]AXR77381.1 Transcriptional regulator, contains HTH domain [Natrarchaeobaculum sulfurireducens]AXR82654.1 Transcriptional activator for anaerobic respiration with dimethyl sulfoxide and trimethylamine-N-oxide [Natrarchaeobaculum sulfurireducens]